MWYVILFAGLPCSHNEYIFEYNKQIGINITDANGKNATSALKGSPEGVFTAPPGLLTSLIIVELLPGENILMEVPPFTVTNAKKVKFVIEGTEDDMYVTNVSTFLTSCNISPLSA